MFNLNDDGFFILRNCIQLNLFNTIHVLIAEQFQGENRINSQPGKLAKVHSLVAPEQVQFLSMSYGGDNIEAEINRLALQVIPQIKKVVNNEVDIEPAASVIASYPKLLTNYKVSFHQDDFYHKSTQRYHVLIPINTSGFNLLQVIPKTHVVPTFNHTSIGPLLRIDDDRLNKHLKDQVTIELNLGDVFVFQTSLVHRLVENDSDDTKWLLRFLCH